MRPEFGFDHRVEVIEAGRATPEFTPALVVVATFQHTDAFTHAHERRLDRASIVERGPQLERRPMDVPIGIDHELRGELLDARQDSVNVYRASGSCPCSLFGRRAIVHTATHVSTLLKLMPMLHSPLRAQT